MTAATNEAIAAVVRDLRAGRIVGPPDFPVAKVEDLPEKVALAHHHQLADFGRGLAQEIGNAGPVIDITALWDQGDGKPYALYEDSDCVFSPWRSGVMAHVGNAGVVRAHVFWYADRDTPRRRDDGSLGTYAEAWTPGTELSSEELRAAEEGSVMPAAWSTENIADWSEIASVITAISFYGGRARSGSRGTWERCPTFGPVWSWNLAVDYDGKLRDARWTRIAHEEFMTDAGMDNDVTAMTKALNFLNCRNVEIADPTSGYSRPERRRLERSGVLVSEIHVLPVGRYRRSDTDRKPVGGGQPLTSVRGHIIRSGVEGRKHLFGNPAVTGRFWVPGHLRGGAEHGRVDQTYRLEPGEAL